MLDGALGRRELLVRVRHRARGALAVAPVAVVADHRERTHLPVLVGTEVPAVAERQLAAHVRLQRGAIEVVVAVQRRREVTVDRLRLGEGVLRTIALQAAEDVLRADVSLEALDRIGNLARQRTRAVVLAEGIVVAAGVLQALVARVAVQATAERHLEHRLLRDRARADVDAAATEGRGRIGRVGLLHRQRLDDRGREDVERQHVTREVRRRHDGAVEARGHVALAQAAHVDELVVHQRHPGHAPQRGRHRAITHAADLLEAQQVDRHVHRQPLGDHVGRAAALPARHHHLLDAVIGDRGLRRHVGGFLGHLRRLGRLGREHLAGAECRRAGGDRRAQLPRHALRERLVHLLHRAPSGLDQPARRGSTRGRDDCRSNRSAGADPGIRASRTRAAGPGRQRAGRRSSPPSSRPRG